MPAMKQRSLSDCSYPESTAYNIRDEIDSTVTRLKAVIDEEASLRKALRTLFAKRTEEALEQVRLANLHLKLVNEEEVAICADLKQAATTASEEWSGFVRFGIAKAEPVLEGSVPALPIEPPLQIHADCVSPRLSFHMEPDFDGGVYPRTPVLSTHDSDDQMDSLSGPKNTLDTPNDLSSQFGTTHSPACISESSYSTPADILTAQNVSSMHPTLSPTSLALSQNKKAPKKKDPNAPKKALSPYLLFAQEYREIVKEENPGIRPSKVAQKLGAKWIRMSDEDKESYVKKHQADKKRVEGAKEAYESKSKVAATASGHDRDE